MFTNGLDDITEELQPAARSTRGWRKMESATLVTSLTTATQPLVRDVTDDLTTVPVPTEPT